MNKSGELSMNIIEAISTRRSVRTYTDEMIEREKLDELIKLGTLAASGSNMQPWGFVIMQGKEEIGKHDEPAKAALLAYLDKDSRFERYRKHAENPDYRIFHNASNMILIYGDGSRPFYINDCTLAASNIMLAAHGMGMGTCWIGLAHGYFNSPEFKASQSVAEGYELVCAMTIGYPAEPVTKPAIRKDPIIFNRS